MNNIQFFSYLAILVAVTYLIRSVPFVAFSKKINNQRIRSFLHYIPYTVLAAMTIPAVFYVTSNVISGIIGFIIAVITSTRTKSLIIVALISCIAVYITELII